LDEEKQMKLAVLIDADNTQASIVEGLLSEVAKYGVASVKRIYGDWTSTMLKSWKNALLEHAIQPIQQFQYTRGKNSTDSAMIIDAMDLLYTENLNGFCIVSSDSDFTRLSSRIREAGLVVYGFGEKKTPQAFVRACDKFIYTDILVENEQSPTTIKKSSTSLRRDTRLIRTLREAVDDSADESGWAYLGNVGQNIANKWPEFDPRNYGYRKLGELIEATQSFEVLERTSDNSPGKSIFVRHRRRKKRSSR
jgi:uncharacterized LabA/DUF88 family protein